MHTIRNMFLHPAPSPSAGTSTSGTNKAIPNSSVSKAETPTISRWPRYLIFSNTHTNTAAANAAIEGGLAKRP